ncbi:MAG: hypothetical protein Q8L14_06445, partial [Myxococcales bacterium]|nr:hypothetical protein [Myxococcales bacterium]
MRHHVAVFAVVVSFTACTCGPTTPPDSECVRNSDCSRGRVCLDGLCVDAAGGGSAAGGSAMGGGSAGGSAMGGGAAGGSTVGGGAAGGSTVGGGAAGGSTVGGGAAGGAAGGSAMDSGTSMDGGATDAGAGDGGSTCACAEFEECVSNVVCVPRYALLQWQSPAPGDTFSPASMVRLEATLLLANGRSRNDPPTLPFEATSDGGRLSGVLSRVDAGLYVHTQSFSLGDWQATVSYPDAGLADGPRAFTIRQQDFTLTWLPPPVRVSGNGLISSDPADDGGTFFRRDETATVVVSNAAPATGVSVFVNGVTADGGTDTMLLTASPSCAACSGAFCACYAVDLSRPALEHFRGRFSFSVSGTVGGTVVTQTSQSHPSNVPTLPVTRWRWGWVNSTPTTDGGFAASVGPALDQRGTLYLGFAEANGGPPSFGVKALSPEGSVTWTQPGLNPTTDLAVGALDGGSRLFAGAQSVGLVTLSSSTGAATTICDLGAGFIATGSIALTSMPIFVTGEVPAVFAAPNGSGPRRLAVGLPSGGPSCSAHSFASAQTRAAFFTSGPSIFFANEGSSAVVQLTASFPSPQVGSVVPFPAGVTTVSDVLPSMAPFVGTTSSGTFVASMPSATLQSGGAVGAGVLSATSAGATLWYPTLTASGLGLRAVDVTSGGLTTGPLVTLPGSNAASVALGAG